VRPRVVVLARGDRGRSATGLPTAASALQQRFVRRFAALGKAVRLPLFSVPLDL
jgi:hypothetical protein